MKPDVWITLSNIKFIITTDYSPELGRWLCRDRIEQYNPYLFVSNHVINSWDFIGLIGSDDIYIKNEDIVYVSNGWFWISDEVVGRRYPGTKDDVILPDGTIVDYDNLLYDTEYNNLTSGDAIVNFYKNNQCKSRHDAGNIRNFKFKDIVVVQAGSTPGKNAAAESAISGIENFELFKKFIDVADIATKIPKVMQGMTEAAKEVADYVKNEAKAESSKAGELSTAREVVNKWIDGLKANYGSDLYIIMTYEKCVCDKKSGRWLFKAQLGQYWHQSNNDFDYLNGQVGVGGMTREGISRNIRPALKAAVKSVYKKK